MNNTIKHARDIRLFKNGKPLGVTIKHITKFSPGPSYDSWVSGISPEPDEPSITKTKQGRTPSQERWYRFMQALNELEESQLDGAREEVEKARVNRNGPNGPQHRISSGSRRLNP
jgi:hypothetical protein